MKWKSNNAQKQLEVLIKRILEQVPNGGREAGAGAQHYGRQQIIKTKSLKTGSQLRKTYYYELYVRVYGWIGWLVARYGA